jgi:hypothetical protein
MQVCALPRGLRRLSLDDLPRERWRNGAGWTRPVASVQHGDALRWRVSLAEIDQASAFSLFPGMDRTTVLVRGGPLQLRQLDGAVRQWRLEQAGDLACYAGEQVLDNLAPDTAVLVWNLMVRRGQADGRVDISADAPLCAAGDRHTLAWVLRGAYVVRRAGGSDLTLLEAGEGLHGSPQGQGWQLVPASPGARLLLTTVR